MNYEQFGKLIAEELVLSGNITLSDARRIIELATFCDGQSSLDFYLGVQGIVQALSVTTEDVLNEP